MLTIGLMYFPSDFNPRPPRGGRRDHQREALTERKISIHAPREGGDTGWSGVASATGISIHAPREGGDLWARQNGMEIIISIHAPREGGDDRGQSTLLRQEHFNPRPPRGGRPPLWRTVRR